MKEKNKPGKKQPAQRIEFLLCDSTGNVEPTKLEGNWVLSPIQCFSRAVEKNPRILAVRFGQIPTRERKALIELCLTLKQNRFTQKCAVLALLHSKHRKLIEDLEQAKVDYMRYVGDIRLDSILIREIIDGLGPDDRPDRHLAMLCPYIHYSKIDSQKEMALCGAYLDRMVLGTRRLQTVCDTENHLRCEYYLKPRILP